MKTLHPQLGGKHSAKSDVALINLGQSICHSYAGGDSWVEVLAAMKDSLGDIYTAKQLGEIMGASTAAFCPEYNDKAPV